MRFDFDGVRTTAVLMGCALVFACTGLSTAARAQDDAGIASPDDAGIALPDYAQAAPEEAPLETTPAPPPETQPEVPPTTTQTTTTQTQTHTWPDRYRRETRTTQARTATPPQAARARPPEEPEDDGRAADIVWIEAIGGYGFVNMRAISYDNVYPELVQLTGEGLAAGLAAGVRISFLSIGGRATLASYTGFEVGTAALEVTLRLPTPVVEPWIRAGFGYGWLGTANYDEPTLSETSVYGYVIQGAIGIDIYLGKVVAIGGGFDLDVLNMSRQALSTMPVSPAGVDLTRDGNAVGLQIRGHVALSLHF